MARRIKERDEEIERRLRPKLPDSLPPEDEQKVQKSLMNRSFLAKAAREQVAHQDLARLRPNAWLNDEIINFYGALISERAAKFENEKEKGKVDMVNGKGKERINGRDYPSDDGVGDPLKIHVFNTYFLAKLQDLGYEKAKLNKWTKKVRVSKIFPAA
jgi:sentrin-specific protease 1